MKIKFAFVVSLLCMTTTAYCQTDSEGIKAMENENYETAKNIFFGLVKANPADALKWYNWGEALYASEKFDSAKLAYQKGIEVNGKLAQNYIGYGKTLLNEGHKSDAIKQFDKAMNIASTKDPLIPTLISQAYLQSDKYSEPDQAIDYASKAIAANKKYSKAYEALGDAYLAKNEGGPAMSNFEYAVDNDKNNKSAILKQGELYIRAKNYTEAINQFNKIIALDPVYPPAHRELAELYFEAKQFDKAKTEYAEYMKYADQNLDSKIRNVKYLYKSKSFESTVNSINELIPQDPDNHLLYRLKCYSCAELNRNEEGELAMQHFFTIAPPSKIIPSDYVTYAKLLQKNGKDSMSIVMMKKAIELDPNNTDFSKDILTMQYKMKKYADVIHDFEDFKSKNYPLDVNSYFMAARSYYVQKDWVKADSANAVITRLAPASASGWIGRAQCNAQLDPESTQGLAKPYYEKYLETVKIDDPKNKVNIVQAYSYLGYYAFLQKDNDGTRSNFEKVLQIDPENKQAKDVLAGLK